MPELPEVETVRSVLDSKLKNLVIKDIKIKYDNIINGDIDSFKKNIINKRIIGLSRLGKFLIFNFDEGNMISHLRMEGKYFYSKDDLDNKHVHVIFYLDNGYYLYYQDVRKFGKMEYKSNDDLYKEEPLSSVGIDPILNKKIDYRFIYDKIVSRNVAIKATLLDQSIIAGLGNIYVDEVLFLSKVNPHRPSNKVTFDEVKAICDNTQNILSMAIKYKGTTIKSYTSELGVEGEFQNFLKVHTKTICPICNTKLTKDKVNGRSTYYCTNCER